MLSYLNNTIIQFPELAESLNAYAVEASWKLGKWDTLEQVLHKPCQNTFEVSLGKLLLSMHKDDWTEFGSHLETTRISLMAPLAAASKESYRRSYEYITKLHILHELETTLRLSDSGPTELHAEHLNQLSQSWDARLEMTAPSFQVREPILNLRRAALDHLR